MSHPNAVDILASIVQVDGDGSTLPARLCADAVRRLPITGASLSTTVNGVAGSMIAASDAVAVLIEELQFTLGEGPCVESSAKREPVMEPALATSGDARWPGFTAAAVERGVGAVFAFPLQVGAIQVGVLDLYRSASGDLTSAGVAGALAYSEAATLILLHLQDQADGELHPQLVGPWATRAEVHQATGMLKVLLGVSITDAFLRLRARAYADERPIYEVARDVIAGRLRLDEADE